MSRFLTFFLLLSLAAAAPLSAGDALAIQDNSFLIEEAYNQEHRVVQHVFTFSRDRSNTWLATFTQEWPAGGQKHQLSYTLPMQNLQQPSARGVGDVLLNYRYQLLGTGESRVAFAPRLSLVLPTGNADRGLGAGQPGFDANLPLSIAHSSKLVTHWNLGAAKTPAAIRGASWSAGGSVIWAALPKVHLMLENRWSRDETDTFVVAPGVRWAHDRKSGLQIVPGIAMPIDTRTSEKSVFLYLSLEHPF